MRNDYSSYFFYFGFNKLASITIRAKVTLNDKVNPKFLTIAVNNYAKRHIWLTKTPIYKNNEYIFVDNHLPIVVKPFINKTITLNAKSSNYHLFYVQYQEDSIYFNISHAIIGGMAFNKLIFAILNEYIDLLENKTKTDKDANKEEDIAPKLADFLDIKEPLIDNKNNEKIFIPVKDNLANLIFKNGVASFFEFNMKDLLPFMKNVNATPATLFTALIFLTLTSLYPKNKKLIHSVILHNPLLSFPKYKNYHGHLISHIYQDFPPTLKKHDLKELCTIIRNSIKQQTSINKDAYIIKNTLEMYEKIDKTKSYLRKGLYSTLNHPMLGLKNSHFTFNVSYNGKNIDKRLEKYVKNYFYIVDGVLLIEIVSLNDKLFLTLPINKNGEKYPNTFEKILKKYEIKYIRYPNEERFLPKIGSCRHFAKKWINNITK